jgi:hypothetical protein
LHGILKPFFQLLIDMEPISWLDGGNGPQYILLLTNQSGSEGALAKTVAMCGWWGGGGGHKWVNPILGEFANRIANMTVGIIYLGLRVCTEFLHTLGI